MYNNREQKVFSKLYNKEFFEKIKPDVKSEDITFLNDIYYTDDSDLTSSNITESYMIKNVKLISDVIYSTTDKIQCGDYDGEYKYGGICKSLKISNITGRCNRHDDGMKRQVCSNSIRFNIGEIVDLYVMVDHHECRRCGTNKCTRCLPSTISLSDIDMTIFDSDKYNRSYTYDFSDEVDYYDTDVPFETMFSKEQVYGPSGVKKNKYYDYK